MGGSADVALRGLAICCALLGVVLLYVEALDGRMSGAMGFQKPEQPSSYARFLEKVEADIEVESKEEEKGSAAEPVSEESTPQEILRVKNLFGEAYATGPAADAKPEDEESLRIAKAKRDAQPKHKIVAKRPGKYRKNDEEIQLEAQGLAEKKKKSTGADDFEPARMLFYGAVTWGSPAWLKPKHSDDRVPRIQGIRMYTAERDRGAKATEGGAEKPTCKVDFVAGVAGMAGFVHPAMPARALSDDEECAKTVLLTDDNLTLAPGDGYTQDFGLHSLESYNKLMPETSSTFPASRRDVISLMVSSYEVHEQKLPQEFLLPLAGFAYDKKYKQHSWLFIREEDRQCFLTFKGASTEKNMTQAMDVSTKSWCGLGKVHNHFRKRMKSMLKAKGFVETIKASMIKECHGVAIFGHSMGGALAEMFAACFLNPDHVIPHY